MHWQSVYTGSGIKINARGSAYLHFNGAGEYAYPTYLLGTSNAVNINDGSTITWKFITGDATV